MIISTPTDPKVAMLCLQVGDIAKQAIEWFDLARRLDELASVQFIFSISRFLNRRVEGGRGLMAEWRYKEENSFLVNRSVGAAYDAIVKTLDDRFIVAIGADLPHPKTESLPIEAIVDVDMLTRDILSDLKKPIDQLIQNIELKVELLDLRDQCLRANTWRLNLHQDRERF